MDRLLRRAVDGPVVNMPTTSEYCVVAPMKKPAWEPVVVPVLPITMPGACSAVR